MLGNSCIFILWIHCLMLVNCTIEKDGLILVNRMADQVRAVLQHYKNNTGPVGLPDAVYKILDPMPIPPIELISNLYVKLTMLNCSVHGLSKSQIESIHTNLTENPQILAEMKIESLKVIGNYSLTSLFSRSVYSCMVTMYNVSVLSLTELSSSLQGTLEASNMDMDISADKIHIDFQNIGYLASLFQNMINKMDVFVFETMKPFILEEVKDFVRKEIDREARKINMVSFPNSISPLDLAIAEGRRIAGSLGLDPYMFPDYSHHAGLFGMFGMYLTNMWVTGLGSFYRVGNMTVSMQNHVVQMGVSVGTDELMGNCHWQISAAGLYSHAGATSFTVEYVQVEINLHQRLDMMEPPFLDSLDMTVGNIQLRSEGTGTMDYVMELLTNLLPNILRYQMIDALREPLRRRFQEILNDVDVDEILNKEISRLEELIMKSQVKTETETNLIPKMGGGDEDEEYSCSFDLCEY
ncbi:uncharacterized protein LOC111054250 [Nilaparvata lugens]|uniref:uncharacterized protein LOC111054250 n=1 Tax=Nilaparvata lugens TaxID=108931 RepID=UPI00193EB926|nr:uncharacterized protein LOC111054250 [Nilaparvata lugens]